MNALQRRETQPAFHPAVVPFGNCTSDDKILTTENEEANPDVGEVVHELSELGACILLVVAVNNEGSRTFDDKHEVDEKANSNGCSSNGLQE